MKQANIFAFASTRVLFAPCSWLFNIFSFLKISAKLITNTGWRREPQNFQIIIKNEWKLTKLYLMLKMYSARVYILLLNITFFKNYVSEELSISSITFSKSILKMRTWAPFSRPLSQWLLFIGTFEECCVSG